MKVIVSKLKQLSLKTALIYVLFVSLVIAVGFLYWDAKKLRANVGSIHNELSGLWGNVGYYGPNNYSTTPGSGQASYKLLSQKVQDLEVYDDTAKTDTAQYKTAKVRVLELEVTNTSSTLISVYNSLGAVDDNGRIITSNVTVKSDQDKNLQDNGYSGLQLAPGGKGTFYLYFKDNGKTITKLYDTATYTEINLK